MCWCGSFKYIPLSYWVYSICKVSLFQWMSSVAMKSSSLNKWSGVTVWTDWACSVKTLWSGGPTEGATRSRDRRGECACGEREGKEEQSVRHISRSLRPPPSLSLSVFVCLSLSLPHTLPLWRLPLLNGGHEKKAGMMLPGGTQGKRHVSFVLFILGWLWIVWGDAWSCFSAPFLAIVKLESIGLSSCCLLVEMVSQF